MIPRPPAWLVITTFLGVLTFVAVVVTMVWDNLGDPIDASRAEAVRNLALVAGGIVALIIAVWRSRAAQDQVRVSERDRLDRRFYTGVSLLSQKEVVSRLAGIRMLGQLAKLEPNLFREDVTRILCEFACNPTAIDKSDAEAAGVLPRFLADDSVDDGDRRAAINVSRREEIEKAIGVVSDCNTAAMIEHPDTKLELNLPGLALHNAKLEQVNLSGADLRGARLVGVNFSSADLSGAKLASSRLLSAKLNGANLTQADLTKATLSLVDLQDAQLADADLSYAELDGATMQGAQIRNTIFTGAILSRAGLASVDSDSVVEAIDEFTATGLTQAMIDQMVAADANPPRLTGILDAETGEPLEWRGRMLLPQSSTGPFRER